MENYKQSNSSLATLDIDIENQKDDINLGIGIFIRNILMRLFNNRQSATTVYNQEHCSSTM